MLSVVVPSAGSPAAECLAVGADQHQPRPPRVRMQFSNAALVPFARRHVPDDLADRPQDTASRPGNGSALRTVPVTARIPSDCGNSRASSRSTSRVRPVSGRAPTAMDGSLSVQSCSSWPVATEKTFTSCQSGLSARECRGCRLRRVPGRTRTTPWRMIDEVVQAGDRVGTGGRATDTGLIGSRLRRAGSAVPGARRTSYQLPVSVTLLAGLRLNDPLEDVTAKTTNVRSSAAAVTLSKVVWAGGAKVASVLPVSESPTTMSSAAGAACRSCLAAKSLSAT